MMMCIISSSSQDTWLHRLTMTRMETMPIQIDMAMHNQERKDKTWTMTASSICRLIKTISLLSEINSQTASIIQDRIVTI